MKCYQLMWNACNHSTSIGNIWKIGIWKNMKSYQSMWNACTPPVRKHSTSIGNISKSYQLMWNACPNFSQFGQVWKVTNWCGMLAHRGCASIPHRLVTFQMPRNIFNIIPHQLVTFEKVTYWCGMLAHNINEWLGELFYAVIMHFIVHYSIDVEV